MSSEVRTIDLNDVAALNRNSLARLLARADANGVLRAYTCPQATQRTFDLLQHVATACRFTGKYFFTDHGIPQKPSTIWETMFELADIPIKSSKGKMERKATKDEMAPLKQFFTLASNPVFMKQSSLVQAWVNTLAVLCRSLPTKEELAKAPQGVVHAPITIPNTAAPSPRPPISSVADGTNTQGGNDPSKLLSPEKKSELQLQIPDIDHHDFSIIVKVLTSDVINSETLKNGVKILQSLCLRSSNQTILAQILSESIYNVGESLRQDIVTLREETVRMLDDRRASTDEQDIPDAVVVEEEDEEEAVAQGANEGEEQAETPSKPKKVAAPSLPSVQLSAINLFTRQGCSQKVMSHLMSIVTGLKDIFVTSLELEMEADKSLSRTVSLTPGQQPQTPSADGASADIVASTTLASHIAANTKPVVQIHLDALWDEFFICLTELTKLRRGSSLVSIVKELVETFFFCHQGMKKARARDLTAQNSTAHLQASVSIDASTGQTLDDHEKRAVATSGSAARFLAFIETHQKMVNELIRKIPNALATEPFSILVHFPQFIEFRVKEEFFRQSLRRNNQEMRHNRVGIRVSRFEFAHIKIFSLLF